MKTDWSTSRSSHDRQSQSHHHTPVAVIAITNHAPQSTVHVLRIALCAQTHLPHIPARTSRLEILCLFLHYCVCFATSVSRILCILGVSSESAPVESQSLPTRNGLRCRTCLCLLRASLWYRPVDSRSCSAKLARCEHAELIKMFIEAVQRLQDPP